MKKIKILNLTEKSDFLYIKKNNKNKEKNE